MDVCQFCGGDLTGRQRTTCAECRRSCKRVRGHRGRSSGYARMSEDQREDRNRRREEQRRQEALERRENRTCIGVDGEGHDGAYFLLAAAGAGFERHLWSSESEGLSTFQCLEFVSALPKEFTAWGFSFGYDANMMLKDVPVHRLQRLHETGFLRWGPFRMQWIPGKMIRVTKREFDFRTGVQGKKVLQSAVIWDMYPWQGRSFVAWLEDWGLADGETLERIRSMKEQRSDFDPADREKILTYCLSECTLLARGAERMHSMMSGAGLDLKTFHSPASASKYLMKENGVQLHRSTLNPPPREVASILPDAYFGGRAEASQVGPIEGPLWLHDIRSAYPTAMQEVPCLAHGRWLFCEGESLAQGAPWVLPWGLYDVSWNAPAALWGPLPVRPRVGSLKYPNRGRGWFWGPEVACVAHLGPMKVHAAWLWEQSCDHKPFAYLGALYEERKRRKAAGDAAEYVLKIALNASYGATAERPQRGMRHPPRWREEAWAGFITAHTRGMIGAYLGPDIVMVATDGILSRSPLPVTIGERLGEWEVERFDEGFVVGPGVYFLRQGDAWVKFKSRGIDARAFKVEDFQAIWDAEGREGALPILQSRFIGLGTALRRINGMEPPTERIWRKFIDFTAVRSLSLEPRRRWLTEGRWDGRSLAPTSAMVAKTLRQDVLNTVRLRDMIRKESDPMRVVHLMAMLDSFTDADGDGKGYFREDEQPWN